MLTPTHGLLAWLFGRWAFRSRPEMVKFLVLGSIFSDIAMTICGLIWFITQGRHPWDIYMDIFIPAIVRYPTRFLHSFIVVAISFLLLALKNSPSQITKIKVVLCGWLFFHLGIDLLTHQEYAHEHLWPLSDFKLYSWFSDENYRFLQFDFMLSAIALLILFFSLLKWLTRKQPPETSPDSS